MQEYENVNFYSHSVMEGKAYAVSGLIKTKYTGLGGQSENTNNHQRLFGFPLTDVHHSIEAGVYMSISRGCWCPGLMKYQAKDIAPTTLIL